MYHIFFAIIVLFLTFTSTTLASTLDDAFEESLVKYDLNTNWGGSYSAQRRGAALFILTIEAINGNSSAISRVTDHINNLLIPGNEPDCTGSLSSRGHMQVIAALALLRNNGTLWSLFSESHNKIDLIVKGCLAATAYVSNDSSPYALYGLNGEQEFSKHYNANYIEGIIGELIASILYFGPPQANDILESFNCNSYIVEANNAGLPTLASLFSDNPSNSNDPSCQQIELQVKNYRYTVYRSSDSDLCIHSASLSYTIFDLADMHNEISSETFGRLVDCGVSRDGYSAGLSALSCSAIPNIGQRGMLKEFDACDSGGSLRSALRYSGLGWVNNIVTAYLLHQNGYYIDPWVNEIRNVGTQDLYYKATQGYLSFAQESSSFEDEGNLSFGYKYIKSVYEYLQSSVAFSSCNEPVNEICGGSNEVLTTPITAPNVATCSASSSIVLSNGFSVEKGASFLGCIY